MIKLTLKDGSKIEVKEGASILELVKRDFGLTVAPAFSDHINDVQPPWTDVTFFRMYMDHPVESQKYLGGANPAPYILFDTIKSNLYKGNVINEGLWATLSNIIKAEFIVTNGFEINEETIELIKKVNETKGVILFLDPDGPGEKIRMKMEI